MEIVASILAILFLLWLVVGFMIFNRILKRREKNSLFKKDGEEKKLVDIECAKYYKQTSITGSDGVSLNGYFAYSTQNKPWVICIHGYGGKATGMVEYIEMFRNLGMNVLTVDLRGHGDSQGNYYTLGVRDFDDIILWTNWLKKSFIADKIILFGISMGGATAIMAAAKKTELYSVVISDSAPSDFNRMFIRILKHRMGLVAHVFMPMLYLYTCVLAGYSLSDASAGEYVSQISIPILYIHGQADGLVPLEMMTELYEKSTCQKERFIVQGAEHTGAIKKDRDLYLKTVSDFIQRTVYSIRIFRRTGIVNPLHISINKSK